MPGYAIIGMTERAVEIPLWSALGIAQRPASVRDLHLETGAHPNAIHHRLSRWVSAGFVTRIEGTPKRYAMNDTAPRSSSPPRVDVAGRTKPRERTGRERLWTAIRVLSRKGAFDMPTLSMTASSTRRATEDLINCLHRAGYLRQLSRGNNQKGTWSAYRLICDTGPKAPSIAHRLVDGTRLRELVDHNTGTRTDISPARVSLRKKTSPTSADGGRVNHVW